MRTVHCDFCNAVLTDHAYDCPARDIDYEAPRTAIDSDLVIDGSIGSWLACEQCVKCVRNGDREGLAERSFAANAWSLRALGITEAHARARLMPDIRSLHDQFWASREGEPVRIDARQIALIASDPPTKREIR